MTLPNNTRHRHLLQLAAGRCRRAARSSSPAATTGPAPARPTPATTTATCSTTTRNTLDAPEQHEPAALVLVVDDAAQRRDLHPGRHRRHRPPRDPRRQRHLPPADRRQHQRLDFMYPRNFIAPDGRVFGFDSNGKMYYVNTSGTGSVTAAGQFSGPHRHRLQRRDVPAGPHPAVRRQLQRRASSSTSPAARRSSRPPRRCRRSAGWSPPRSWPTARCWPPAAATSGTR